ncbi:cas4-nuclease [uncultured Mediterranean phage uvMED]|nr:cas4-nuclease [uncultured Mediterranean phage uvMED]
MSSNSNVINIPSNAKIIPSYFIDRGLDHFSPTQATTPLDVWIYKYLHCNQEKRRKMKGSSKMRCGVLAGDSVAADISGKVRPIFHYDGYKEWNDEKDEMQWKNDKEFINATIEQIFLGLKDVGIKWKDKRAKVVFEYYVSYEDDRLVIPIIGRTDIQTPTALVELKTKWSRRGAKKKDGTNSFSFPKLKDEPEDTHLQQSAMYYHATKIPTFIVQATAKEFKVFDIREKDHKAALNELVVNCMKKQEVAKLDEPQKVIQPDFSHYTWNIGDEFLKEAKELYGY